MKQTIETLKDILNGEKELNKHDIIAMKAMKKLIDDIEKKPGFGKQVDEIISGMTKTEAVTEKTTKTPYIPLMVNLIVTRVAGGKGTINYKQLMQDYNIPESVVEQYRGPDKAPYSTFRVELLSK